MTQRTSPAQSAHLLPEPAQARILVVDDEAPNLKLLSLVLSTEGYARVDTLSNPREVLARRLANPSDLILIDINCRTSTASRRWPNCRRSPPPLPPVIVLTSQAGGDFVLRALRGARSIFSASPSIAASCWHGSTTCCSHAWRCACWQIRTHCSNSGCSSAPTSYVCHGWTSCAAWGVPPNTATTRPVATCCA